MFIPVTYYFAFDYSLFKQKIKYSVKDRKNKIARKRPHISIRRVIDDFKKSVIIDNGD